MDSTEQGFHADIADALRRGDIHGWALASQIYADWLEERGEDEKAARRRHKVAVKRDPGLRWPRVRHLDRLSEHQRLQLAIALSRPLGILCGTPGTGKTYCTAALALQLLLQSRASVDDVALCAPTGKAAVRLAAVIRARSIAARCVTIHQLLQIGRNGHDGEGWGFLRNAEHPLDARYVIVDEASMLDTDLASSLFAACRPGTHVLLVGDANQLPPVGHGAPLRDLVAAGVPCGRLTEIQRNAGHIVEVCAAIHADERWGPGGNLQHEECATPAEQLACLKGVLEQQRRDGRDPVWELQVLAAVNTRGELSRQNLNRRMQEQLNTRVAPATGSWRPGDKVVCLRNHLALGAIGHGHTVYVANGEVGHMLRLHAGHAVVGLLAPHRQVLVPLPHTARDTDEEPASDDDRRAPWDLAYALTAHKAQGSEWPVVILMIDASSAARHICTREWVYTALSRGKDRVITIGKLSVLKQMCKRVSLDHRKTFLMELLGNGMRKS